MRLLVDQGTADGFLENQLKPDTLKAACAEKGLPLTLRMQEGYDHSYFFISSFVSDHLKFHASHLTGQLGWCPPCSSTPPASSVYGGESMSFDTAGKEIECIAA